MRESSAFRQKFLKLLMKNMRVNTSKNRRGRKKCARECEEYGRTEVYPARGKRAAAGTGDGVGAGSRLRRLRAYPAGTAARGRRRGLPRTGRGRRDGGAAARAAGADGGARPVRQPALTGADAPRTQRGGDGGRRGDALRESAHRHGAPAAGPAARRRQHGGAAARGGGSRPEAPLRRGGAADQRNAAHGGKGGKPDAA